MVGVAALYYLFEMGGIAQIQGMLGGGGGNNNNVSAGLDKGINIGNIHIGTDGINVPGIGGINGSNNNYKVQRNINNSSGNVHQSSNISQYNGKTIQGNMVRISYD